MTGKATFAACAWIKQNYPEELHFLLEGQFATDKKTSIVNMLHTRGKRVVAEITLPAALVEKHMNVTTDKLFNARMRGQLGSIMSVTNNNGLHSANGITAMFIATGQDVANVAESSALYGFSELLPNGDFYASVTLPSLIVATYGGGTGLATQRECLEMLGCYGSGGVRQADRDHRRNGPCRGAVAGIRRGRRGVGPGARRLRTQPILTGHDG